MMEDWDPRSWLHYVSNSATSLKLSVWSAEWWDGRSSYIIDLLTMFAWYNNPSLTDFIGETEWDNDTRQDYKFTRLNLFCVSNKQTE